MLVQELTKSRAITCHTSDAALECARLMRRENIGFVPVLDDHEELVGVVTDRDLALRLVAADLPLETPVGHVMSADDLLCVFADDTLRTLEERMALEHRSRAVVVDHDGNLLGVVSLADVVRAEPSAGLAARLLKELTRRDGAPRLTR